MEVCLELFLLDNFLMDALIVSVAGALCGRRQRAWGSVAAALLGAVYAAVSMGLGGFWLLWPCKVLVSLGMIALAFRFHTLREAGLCALCFYAATAVTGGIAFALLSMFGGVFESGMLVLPDTLRPTLLALCVAAALPRAVRYFTAKRQAETRARMRVHWPGRVETVSALIDTGNQLCEPISGAPVMVLSSEKMPPHSGRGRAVMYTSLGGKGMLWALKPQRVEWETGEGWRDMPITYAAAAPHALAEGIDAIVGAQYMAQALSAKQPVADFADSKKVEG